MVYSVLKEVDQIEIKVLVDNYTDLLRADDTDVVRRPDLPMGEVLLAEHGLSLLITLKDDQSSFSILMDAGASDISLNYNALHLGVNLKEISAIVISHGHDDHIGSLTRILKEANNPVVVYIHPGAFAKRRKIVQDRMIDMITPDIQKMENSGAEVSLTKGPTHIWDNKLLITGEVERITSFERINPVYYVKEAEEWVNDQIRDDQAVILNLKNKGLVIITGCAHSGVINTIYYARKITGVDKVHAVIGGFHLSGPFFSQAVDETISAMKETGPDWVIPMHCTGWEATSRFIDEMPKQVIINTSGSAYHFGE
jgi:7,8-dihydropterin-6-yl-methyl-4-(beta-D-ribofuranosyl)aminobenzene 5'-phosphate synthase